MDMCGLGVGLHLLTLGPSGMSTTHLRVITMIWGLNNDYAHQSNVAQNQNTISITTKSDVKSILLKEPVVW